MFDNKKIFYDLKKPDSLLNPAINCSTQDMIEIEKVSLNGIYYIGNNKWSKSYLIQDVNYTTKTFEEQISFFENWCKVINSLDVSIKITVLNKQKSSSYIEDHVLYKSTHGNFKNIRDAYNEHIYLNIQNGKNRIEQLKIITVIVERKDYDSALSYLMTLESSLINNFASFGSKLLPQSANERIQILYDFYHSDSKKPFNMDIEKEILSGACWKNRVSSNFISFNDSDKFIIENNEKVFGSVLYLDPDSYPEKLDDQFFIELTNIKFPSIFTIDLQSIPKNVAISTLETKLMGIEKDITTQQRKRNRNHDFSSEVSYKVRRNKKEVEEMLDNLREHDQKVFWHSLSCCILADSEKNLEDEKTTIKQIFEKYSCKIVPYYYKQREALATVLPVGGRYIDIMRTLFTGPAAVFIPFNVMEIQMMEQPFFYGINQISKNTIMNNRKKLLNGNGFVVGIPGSGKSMTGCKFEVGSIMTTTSDDVIIIDPTYEYFDVAPVYGGEMIDLSTNSHNYLNPLEINLEDLDCDDSNGIIRDKIQFLCGLTDQAMEGGMDYEHKTIVDRSTRILYSQIAKLPLEQRYQPILSDFRQILGEQDEEKAKTIMLAYEVFTLGSLNVFNHLSNVTTTNRLTIYGIRDLSKNLTGMALAIMLENIKLKILSNFKKGKATWLYIDEFHVLLNKKYSSEFFCDLWRQIRKLGGLCTGLTQNIASVLGNPDTATLVSNSEYVMFLKQSTPDIEAMSSLLTDLSAAQINYVANASKGEGLIKFGTSVVPFENKISRDNMLYDLYNTDMHEKIAKKK